MSRKFLYRRLGSAVIVILALIVAAAPRSAGQGDKPTLKRPGNNVPDDRPPVPKKTRKGKSPRAVGVVQFTSNGKGTLIPIAILIDGKFYDASAYKADPVPMALESGTVYEVEQAGDSQGLFTISGALHSTTAGSAHPWVGTGSYLPRGTEAPKSTRKAEDVPVGLDSSSGDEPPRLTRGNAAKPAEAASSPSAASTSGASAGGGPSEKPGTTTAPASAQPAGGAGAGTSSRETPKVAAAGSPDKPADQGGKEQAPQAAAAGQAAPNQSAANESAPSQTSTGQAAPGQTSGQTTSGQGEENYYRPTLRRGKPTQSAPQEDEPAAKSDKSGAGGAASNSASAGPARFVPAISDEGGPDPRPYQFFWKTGEEDEQRKQMLALAANEVQAYWNARAKGAIGVKPPAAKATGAGRKAAAKPAEPVLENIQFHTFDVWGNNQPVMILSADAHLTPARGAAPVPEPCSITVVARTDIYGNLRKLYSGVTDKFHLDVTPRLELIDAVDADGDGRGELLFRETTDTGSGYVIYRATADKLWKMFDSRGE